MLQKEIVLKLATILGENKAEDVAVIDISKLNSFADYLIIVTATSTPLMRSLQEKATKFLEENSMDLYVPKQKTPDGDDWTVLDASGLVLHLMTKEARQFYDIEELWKLGQRLL